MLCVEAACAGVGSVKSLTALVSVAPKPPQPCRESELEDQLRRPSGRWPHSEDPAPSVRPTQGGLLVSRGSARFSVHGDRASVVKQKPDIQEDQLLSRVARSVARPSVKDLHTLRDPAGVILGGQWISRTDLRKMRKQ